MQLKDSSLVILYKEIIEECCVLGCYAVWLL
jgi:hypothetical protein